MTLTPAQLRSIAGPKARAKNTEGVVASLPWLERFGIDKPPRLAHFIAQIAHESDRFKTTSEYASGAAYEGRKDLGNTRAGDGRKFKGHGLIQVTGRANHREFTKWMRKYNPQCPDFEASPTSLTEFPWAMLGAVWYWETRKLNAYADANNIEMITRRINGGLNGYSDRLSLYTRTALVLLGYEMKEGVIAKFQKDAGIKVDDLDGPQTRSALHKKLATAPVVDAPSPTPAPPPPVKPEPSEPAKPVKWTMGDTVAAVGILGVIAFIAWKAFG